MPAIARHVLVTGVVQGVGYRAWTERTARANGLSGWVRNRTDGSVEAVFAGEAKVVEAMISQCWRGPRSAIVTGIAVAEHAGASPKDFRVLATL